MDISDLKAYHGYQSSLIPFSGGHYLYIASWDSTPTKYSSFSNIWVITPEDKRILFVDPPAAAEIVCLYHDFHEINGGSISLDWVSNGNLQMRCKSNDVAHHLSLDFNLFQTTSSRLLVALAGKPPTRFTISKPIVALSNFMLNLMVTKGGLTVFGKTETGQPFYNGAADRLMLIKAGSATMNGSDLGNVSRPTWPIEFGDATPAVQSVMKLGTLYIPFNDGMLIKRA
jgi:hypothetical protein